jgi:hypothetical protein
VGLADDLGLRADVDRVPGASSIHVPVPGTASTGALLWLPRVLSYVVLALAAAPALLLFTPQLILMAESPGDGAAPAVATTLLLLASLAPQLLVVAGADPRTISSTESEPRGAHEPPLAEAAV